MARQMKDSGVEWIGKIPEDWTLNRIGNMYSERRQKVNDRDYKPLSVTMKGIVPQLSNAAKTDAHDDRKLVLKGDFAINSRSDRRGSCGISQYDGSVSLTQTSHTENIPYALINQLELNVESHSRTLLCTQTTHPKSGQIVQESFQERFDQQDF